MKRAPRGMIPCDRILLDGDGYGWALLADLAQYVPDCDGTGRDTFDIEVACSCVCHSGRRTDRWACIAAGKCDPTHRTLRVHVLGVLPIHHHGDHWPVDHAHIEPSGDRWVEWLRNKFYYSPDRPRSSHEWVWRYITLPPAAKPGMHAVRLAVHS